MGTHIFPGRGPCRQVPLPEAPYKVDGFLAAVFERHTCIHSLTVPSNSSRTIVLWYGLIYTAICYRYSFSWSSSTGPPLLHTNAPDLFGGRGEMATAVPCCRSFYGTACAFGLTWRPFTGSLCLSSFWCRLKPGPSGERGRKSGLLQDMLVTGLGPTSELVDGRVQAWTRLALDSFKGSNPVWKATGHNEPVDGRVQTWTRHGRAIIPRTDGQRPKDRSYAVVLTYYWVRGRVTSLVGLFVFPFVLFGHFFVFRGPGAGASGHTGSLPGCAEQSVLCPGGG